MILGGVDGQRGAPVATFWDPWKAQQQFEAIQTPTYLITGNRSYWLIAYEVSADGSMKELMEMGVK
jgi:hypothetical protein